MGSLINLIYLLTLGSVQAYIAHEQLAEINSNKFYYFGFGSNMLSQRIHLQNPTALRVGPALLENFRLDFAEPTQRWKGAVATIVPTLAAETWGTLWEIELSNLPDLDNQEGVHLGIYVPLTVQVKLRNGTMLAARAYHLVKQPVTNLHYMPPEEVPELRQPSKTYLQCLVKGAIESGMPKEYIENLQATKHNGRVTKDLEDLLQLKDVYLQDHDVDGLTKAI